MQLLHAMVCSLCFRCEYSASHTAICNLNPSASCLFCCRVTAAAGCLTGLKEARSCCGHWLHTHPMLGGHTGPESKLAAEQGVQIALLACQGRIAPTHMPATPTYVTTWFSMPPCSPRWSHCFLMLLQQQSFAMQCRSECSKQQLKLHNR